MPDSSLVLSNLISNGLADLEDWSNILPIQTILSIKIWEISEKAPKSLITQISKEDYSDF
jgi:hypothetical protein